MSKLKKIRDALKSVRVKLFLMLSLIVLLIIAFLILVNNFVFGQFYLYSKTKDLKEVYEVINDYYNNPTDIDINSELEKLAINNNFDILIKDDDNINIFTSNKDFLSTFGEMNAMTNAINAGELIEENDKFIIRRLRESKTGISYILLSAKLDNDYLLYIRIPVSSIQESVKISNNFLYLIAGFTILISAVIVNFVSRKFTEPILELNTIAKNMANLDFSHKYRITDADDEINNLGKSINQMSDKLESTIKQLRNTNIELERDIEEKSKIDEMRKSFISDVSHELKTPIALIQGYSEGLLENVNTDDESKKFYAEVILDETNKMDKLVKQLLELMKLEYGKREFSDKEFNIVELEKEVIRKSKVMLDEKQVEVELLSPDEIINLSNIIGYPVFTRLCMGVLKHKFVLLQDGAAAIIVNKHGQILLQSRTDNDRWGLPGGCQELGERFEDTIIREVKEETGYTVEPVKLLNIYTSYFHHHKKNEDYQSYLIYYLVKVVDGEISDKGFDDDEKEYAKKAKWLDIEELKNMRHACSIDITDELINMILNN